LEFIAQVAVLTGAVEGRERPTETGAILARLKPDFAAPAIREELSRARVLYEVLTQVIRLCLTGPLDPKDIPPGLLEILLRAADLPDLSVLEAELTDTARAVAKDFDSLLGTKRK
jgi:glutamate-ammonia-ligase adenylyltransferase